MSGSGDDLRRLAADLGAYLRQRREAGMEWYLDDGGSAAGRGDAAPPETAPPDAPSPRAARPEPAPREPARPAADRPRTPAAAAGPASRPAPRGGAADADDFARSCEQFVAQTLAQLRRQAGGDPRPRQRDIFAAAEQGEEAEAPALSRAEKEAALADLSAEVEACTRCPLYRTRTRAVFGVGDADADLVLIGEAPGRDEDLQGEPFVGRAGKLLNEILKAIGLERADVYICNILKSRPPNNRDPEAAEVEACEPYLRRQLQIIQPRVIGCLGRVAAQNLLKTRASLGNLRQSVHFYAGIPVVVTYHPAALLRNPHWKRPTWDDVRRLRALHDALRERDGS